MASYTSKAECLLDEVDRQRVANRNFATISQPLFRRLLNKPIYRHGGRLICCSSTTELDWQGSGRDFTESFYLYRQGQQVNSKSMAKVWRVMPAAYILFQNCVFGRAMTRWWTLSQNELCTFPNDIIV